MHPPQIRHRFFTRNCSESNIFGRSEGVPLCKDFLPSVVPRVVLGCAGLCWVVLGCAGLCRCWLVPVWRENNADSPSWLSKQCRFSFVGFFLVHSRTPILGTQRSCETVLAFKTMQILFRGFQNNADSPS